MIKSHILVDFDEAYNLIYAFYENTEKIAHKLLFDFC